MSSSRAFPNPFPDYSGEQFAVKADGKFKLDANFSTEIKGCIQNLLSQLQRGVQQTRKNDSSVYTGHTGIAMLYLHLYDNLPEDANRQTYLETAVAHLQPSLKHLGSDVYTFLCGDAGILAIGAVLCARVGDMKKSKECVDRLESMHTQVVKDPGIPDEHLYGRAGYLAAVMFVQSHLGEQAISAQAIGKVAKAILSSGRELSKKKGWPCPLMYRWYKEYYLGAAHGLAGIFYTLLLIKDPQVRPQILELVRPSLDYLLTLQLPSGNFPPVIGEQDDRLVHWCHGAPGWASMWALAYQVYNDRRYLEAAERCCDVTWQRGLLKKGYGLCHGAAGNAYAFLALFRLTQDQKYLYRACKFAEWCFQYGQHGCRIPDTPFSLFEGMAGTIYFLCDLLDPMKARFPAYEY
ncbi:glutathione S-transferase LANCL1-like [Babylonia areolata]|uniref:glutathione S-transferase LANCL1-like n=1 Tax=Babylonia areolata TaxID=304850 RepID=UPI003FD69337